MGEKKVNNEKKIAMGLIYAPYPPLIYSLLDIMCYSEYFFNLPRNSSTSMYLKSKFKNNVKVHWTATVIVSWKLLLA